MKSIPFTIREFNSIKNNKSLLKDAMSYHKMKMKKVEEKDFKILLNLILNELKGYQDIGGLFFDTDIKVAPDFDCLMLFKECIINIDLKDKYNKKLAEKVRNKFKTQERILKLTHKKFNNFVFYADKKKLLYFNKSNNFESRSIREFVNTIVAYNALSDNLIYSL